MTAAETGARAAPAHHHLLARLLGAHRGARLHVLHNAAFRRLWLARLASAMGSFTQGIAIAWVILRAGGGPSALGLVVALATLPSLLTTLYGGALADRMPRGRVIVASQLLLSANAVLLAVLSELGGLGIAVLLVTATASGLFAALGTPALRAITRDIVGDEDLAAAVSLTSLEFNAAKVVGPAMAGLLLGYVGVTACFAVNAVSFAAMIAVVPGLDTRVRSRPARRRSLAGDIREALGVVGRTPALIAVLIVVFGLGLFGFNIAVMAPLIAHYLLDGTPADFGLVTTAAGAGSIVAAVVTLGLRQVTFQRVLLGAAAMAVALLGVGLVALDRPSALAAMFVFGFAGTILLTAANTIVQLLADPELEGRIVGIYLLGVVGTTPVGGLLLGLLADRLGVADALTVMGAASFAAVATGALYARRHGLLRLSFSTTTSTEPGHLPAGPTRSPPEREAAALGRWS